MKEGKGSVATHSWDLHEYLYITEKHRRVIDCDKVPNSGCYHQALTSTLDDVEGTTGFGGEI